MYDINRLLVIVSDALNTELDMKEYCRKVRAEKDLSPDDTLWIPSLDGNTAHRLGELCERDTQKWTEVADICAILNINQNLLVAAVKAIRRWEVKYGQVVHVSKDNACGARLMQFLRDKDDGQFYESTGRRKAWCKREG